jgi:hypothetical protein
MLKSLERRLNEKGVGPNKSHFSKKCDRGEKIVAKLLPPDHPFLGIFLCPTKSV